MITSLQARMWVAVCTLTVDGVCPTYQQLADRVGLGSRSQVKRVLDGLEERGFLRRLPKRARAIEILIWPEALKHKMAAMPRYQGKMWCVDLHNHGHMNDEQLKARIEDATWRTI